MVADNAIDISPDSLAALHETVTEVLSGITAPNTPKLMDRLPVGEGGALTQQFAHKGLIFSFPATTTDLARNRDLVRVAEELRITGLWQIKPKDQTTSLRSALAWEELIAATVRNAPLLRRFNPTYQGSSRAPATASQEWWTFTLTFQLTREIR